jgi:hypothetical protein
MALPSRSGVAQVHDWHTGMRGGEKVLEAIAERFPGAPIHTLFHFEGSVSPALEAHPIVTSYLQKAPGIRRHYRRYLPLFPAAIESFDLSGYDLVISTSHCVAKGAIPGPRARHRGVQIARAAPVADCVSAAGSGGVSGRRCVRGSAFLAKSTKRVT